MCVRGARDSRQRCKKVQGGARDSRQRCKKVQECKGCEGCKTGSQDMGARGARDARHGCGEYKVCKKMLQDVSARNGCNGVQRVQDFDARVQDRDAKGVRGAKGTRGARGTSGARDAIVKRGCKGCEGARGVRVCGGV